MTKIELNEFMDKLHLRSFDKIWKHARIKYPDLDKNELKKVFDKRLKDIPGVVKKNKKYYNPVFSSNFHSYQMDLVENNSNFTPRYWYVFINTNTRMAFAYPLKNKAAADVLNVLKEFITANQVSTLTGDDESAFSANKVVEYLTDKDVSLRIILEQQHGALSIIDRFIRTIRDMNIPTQKTVRQSSHLKYVNFSLKRMKKLLSIYNNTCHSGISMNPSEMQANKELERNYIRKCLFRKLHKPKNPDLCEGEWVRYILSKDKMKKRRYVVSREAYRIAGREGLLYIISAKDGCTRLMPRWRLVTLGSPKGKGQSLITKPKNIKEANTFEGVQKGVINKIISYGKDKKHYKVQWDLPRGEKSVSEIPISFMRGSYPQLMGAMEKEFIKKVGNP